MANINISSRVTGVQEIQFPNVLFDIQFLDDSNNVLPNGDWTGEKAINTLLELPLQFSIQEIIDLLRSLAEECAKRKSGIL